MRDQYNLIKHEEGETCTVSDYDENMVFPLSRASIAVGSYDKCPSGDTL